MQQENKQVQSSTGSCACAYVRYRLVPPAQQYLICHCQSCRQHSAKFNSRHHQDFTSWVDTRYEFFSLEAGELIFVPSSPDVMRGYCPKCQMQITYDHVKGNLRDFGVTKDSLEMLEMLDQSDAAKLQLHSHIWTISKVVEINDVVPIYAKQTPDFQKLLAQELEQ